MTSDNAKPQTLKNSVKSIWQAVMSLDEPVRLRSPAHVFMVMYDACIPLQKGISDADLVTLKRMQIELEGLLNTGHFPQSGQAQKRAVQAGRLIDYLRAATHALAQQETHPEWTPDLALALKEVMAYLTEYLGSYHRLNGHLPLFGPFYKGEPHPWDKSPWSENPYDNTYTR